MQDLSVMKKYLEKRSKVKLWAAITAIIGIMVDNKPNLRRLQRLMQVQLFNKCIKKFLAVHQTQVDTKRLLMLLIVVLILVLWQQVWPTAKKPTITLPLVKAQVNNKHSPLYKTLPVIPQNMYNKPLHSRPIKTT